MSFICEAENEQEDFYRSALPRLFVRFVRRMVCDDRMARCDRKARASENSGASLHQSSEVSRDKNAILQAQIAYGPAQASSDGAIDGFTTALVQGSAPQNLPTLQTYLDSMGNGLQTVCDTAVTSARAAKGTKGVVDGAVAAAVKPIIDALRSAAGAIWDQHVQQTKIQIETIRTQLDKAHWPDF
jgi:hypothetical protein